jgi:hypothetical protein
MKYQETTRSGQTDRTGFYNFLTMPRGSYNVFAWDLRGDSKTVVRGAYGMFYQDPSGDITHSVDAPWRGSIQLRSGLLNEPSVLGGSTITGLPRYQSGSPLNFLMGTDQAVNGTLNPSSGQHAQLAPGATASTIGLDQPNRTAEVPQYFDTSAFVRPSQLLLGIYGNAGRGIDYGPRYFDTDRAVLGKFQLVPRDSDLNCAASFLISSTRSISITLTQARPPTFGRITGAQPGRVLSNWLRNWFGEQGFLENQT